MRISRPQPRPLTTPHVQVSAHAGELPRSFILQQLFLDHD